MKLKQLFYAILFSYLAVGKTNAAEFEGQQYLDYQTGTIKVIPDSLEIYDYKAQYINTPQNSDMIVEYRINYAVEFIGFKDIRFWSVLGVGYNYMGYREPLLSVIFPNGMFVSKNNIKNITLLDSAYVDFNITTGCTAALPEFDANSVYREIDESVYEIMPYVGFFPENLVSDQGYYDSGRWHIYAMQYDYQNSILRCYKYLKYKIEYLDSSIINVESDDPENLFYDIMGYPILNPTPGRLYLKREGQKFQKIIY